MGDAAASNGVYHTSPFESTSSTMPSFNCSPHSFCDASFSQTGVPKDPLTSAAFTRESCGPAPPHAPSSCVPVLAPPIDSPEKGCSDDSWLAVSGGDDDSGDGRGGATSVGGGTRGEPSLRRGATLAPPSAGTAASAQGVAVAGESPAAPREGGDASADSGGGFGEKSCCTRLSCSSRFVSRSISVSRPRSRRSRSHGSQMRCGALWKALSAVPAQHAWQRTRPHHLQWWRRTNSVKRAPHSMHARAARSGTQTVGSIERTIGSALSRRLLTERGPTETK
mmetsp:Transcript_14320/g.32397  ORF Transcript_14320/g.32397 Transcript_14320/m.32397 type:complete len:280 (-) Transcript_14320:144-983(-)